IVLLLKSDHSVILTGLSNSIKGSSHSLINTGTLNEIIDSKFSIIGTGNRNKIINETITAGNDIAAYDAIIGGEDNIIKITTATDHPTCIGYSFIGCGKNNTIINKGSYSVICGGELNKINDETEVTSLDTSHSFIGGGKNNSIQGGLNSIIIGGDNNLISSCDYSVISGGQNNSMTDNSNGSTISGGV